MYCKNGHEYGQNGVTLRIWAAVRLVGVVGASESGQGAAGSAALQLSLYGREQSELPWSTDVHSAAVKRSANKYLSIPISYLDVADEVSLTA